LVLGVDVALKLIRASTAGSGLASRMAREAHAAARLGHPALVRVFDFGWTGRGDPFLVMELVQGETLWAVLNRENRLAAIPAVQMLLPIADGLRLAHDKKIIHRDIKPENIFLGSDALGRKQPKLLDFGIAKVDPTPTDNKLTQGGVILGSPEYMSPEQARGDEVDERTDVWSLCIVLYETITGAVPFRKANYNALMQAIIHEAPVPTTQHDAGDVALWQVIERGLAKQRNQRWANMTEFGEALALWLYEHGVKEDLSGNSIRAVWLDGALSGVRHELASGSHAAARAAAPQDSDVDNARRPFDTTQSIARPLFNRKRTGIFVLGLALGGGAVALALALSSKTPSESRSARLPSVSEASALDRQPVSAPADSILPPQTTPPPASGDAPAAKEAPAPANTSKSKAPRTNSATPKPAARPAKPSHDFGF
ncbi:MAG: serine/threonine-protein kinase, partial [Polyangiaceae bacterium]